jgi:hypothetical protein
MSSPVTQDDVDSVKDVPIEEALTYLETSEMSFPPCSETELSTRASANKIQVRSVNRPA